MLYSDSHKIVLPALMENGFNYLPLFHYAVENKTNTENRSNYGYIYGFDYGNGYTSTATENLTSNFCFENACNFNRYSYCLNNPLKYKDPTGWRYVDVDDDYGLDRDGRITLLRETKDKFDRLIVLDGAGKETNRQMTLNKNNWWDKTILFDLFKSGKASNYATSFAVGDESSQSAMLKVFKFASDNTRVEWRVDRYFDNSYAIGTAHSNLHAITSEQMGRSTYDVMAFIHSHPGVNSSWELGSMGFYGFSNNTINTRQRTDLYYKSTELAYQTALYYTYFPESGNVWNVRANNIPAFIRNVKNYKGFFWGTLNTW